MSYAAKTVLVRDEQNGNEFDKVRVVGPSPIRTSQVDAEWGGGVQGDLQIVEPIGSDELASPAIVPLAALQGQYTVEYEPDPDPTHVETAARPTAVRQLAPEEQFRVAAKQAEQDGGEAPRNTERERTPIGAGVDDE